MLPEASINPFYVSPLKVESKSLWTKDLSGTTRFGIRGKNAAVVLEKFGLTLPDKINTCIDYEWGLSVLRVGRTEYWLCSNTVSESVNNKSIDAEKIQALVAELIAAAKGFSHCYFLPLQHSHAHLAMRNPRVQDVLAKLCAIDLSPEALDTAPGVGAVVQTSIAKTNVVIALHNQADIPCFSIFCDSANVSYLWESIVDAEQEFIYI